MNKDIYFKKDDPCNLYYGYKESNQMHVGDKVYSVDESSDFILAYDLIYEFCETNNLFNSRSNKVSKTRLLEHIDLTYYSFKIGFFKLPNNINLGFQMLNKTISVSSIGNKLNSILREKNVFKHLYTEDDIKDLNINIIGTKYVIKY